jgi:hypothetical protein
MATARLLLPFTYGIEMDVLEYAVLLAKQRRATLVPLALLTAPAGRRSKGVRLEQVQQAKDFLEAVRHKAERHTVPLERFEVVTSDVVQSIAVLVRQLSCDGVVLAVRGQDGALLHVEEIEQLMASGLGTLYIIRLPPRGNNSILLLLNHLIRRLFGGRERLDRPSLTPQALQKQAKQAREGIVYPAVTDLEKITAR